ncbi:UNVERIFIED_CONTAM: hypothetical protein Sradi_1423400 [Sesamum radiatum]|uniref:Uncharacterized protein n=1 Tax=Sesamum radiatum TaxID=300843 RepID=A0AAW2US68_SESRA
MPCSGVVANRRSDGRRERGQEFGTGEGERKRRGNGKLGQRRAVGLRRGIEGDVDWLVISSPGIPWEWDWYDADGWIGNATSLWDTNQ